jgi:hypothetical protein
MFVSLKDFLGDMRKTARRQKGMKIKKGKKRELGQMITCTKLCLLHEEIYYCSQSTGWQEKETHLVKS